MKKMKYMMKMIKKMKNMKMMKKKRRRKRRRLSVQGRRRGGKGRRGERKRSRNIKPHFIIKYFLVLTHLQYEKKLLWHVHMLCSANCNIYSSGPSFMTLKGTGGQKFGL
jgi:hypothetical protein